MKKIKITSHIVDCNSLYESASVQSCPPSFWLLAIFGIIIGFINGFWGGGGGMMCVPILTNIVGLKEKQAHATAILIMLPLSIVSFVVYILSGALDGLGAIKCTIGFVAGGAIGALLLKDIKNTWLNIIFAAVIIASGIKLVI